MQHGIKGPEEKLSCIKGQKVMNVGRGVFCIIKSVGKEGFSHEETFEWEHERSTSFYPTLMPFWLYPAVIA